MALRIPALSATVAAFAVLWCPGLAGYVSAQPVRTVNSARGLQSSRAASPARAALPGQALSVGSPAVFLAAPAVLAAPGLGSSLPALAAPREDGKASAARSLTEGMEGIRDAKDADLSAAVERIYDDPALATRQGAEFLGAERVSETGLKPAGDSSARQPAAPRTAPPAPPATRSWLLPVAGGTLFFWGLDFLTKLGAWHWLDGVAFHEAAWRKPLLMVAIPYLIYAAYTARYSVARTRDKWHWSAKRIGQGSGWREKLGFFQRELSGVVEMTADHPSLKPALKLYNLSIAMMLGGLLGNGVDVLVKGGALDFIPVGRSLINVADVTLLFGLAYFQLATRFFERAGEAHRHGAPLQFGASYFLGLPLAGIFIAWTFGSGPTPEPLHLVMSAIGWVYLLGLSMLLGITRLGAAAIVDPLADRFRKEAADKKKS